VDFTTQTEGARGTVKLSGGFTFDAAAAFNRLTQALMADGVISKLCLDFSGVTHLESSALGVLLLLREQAEAKGIKISVLKPNAKVRATLDGVRFGTIFEIQD